MKVLVVGTSGMLGHKVVATLSRRFEVAATARNRLPVDPQKLGVKPEQIHYGVDVENPDSIMEIMQRIKPDVVVNCVGIIKQLAQANDPIKCLTINSLLPHRLAVMCSLMNARLIHISTDCVFAGKTGMYKESDPSDAQDLYGRSKFLGETAAPNAITLRTSIIGHELGTNFSLVDWFLSQQGKTTRGFKWAFFSGLTTLALSNVIADVIEKHQNLTGLWHVAVDRIDKDTLLNLIKERYDANIEIIPEDDQPLLDRSLDASRFNQATGYQPQPWPELIDQMYQDPFRLR